jgi:hypothetical protein
MVTARVAGAHVHVQEKSFFRKDSVTGGVRDASALRLAAHIVLGAAWSLSAHHAGEFSIPGPVVAAMAMPATYSLARRKLNLARQRDSGAMRPDAIESITCGWIAYCSSRRLSHL